MIFHNFPTVVSPNPENAEAMTLGMKLGTKLNADLVVAMMSLSISLPKDDEIEKVCTEVQFQLIKRSGFVNSMTYADTFRKKKDFYGFVAGSCFKIPYQGDIYDVSIYGKHPVYRYAIPIFMGVI